MPEGESHGGMLLECVYPFFCGGFLPWRQEDEGSNRALPVSEAALVQENSTIYEMINQYFR